MMPKGDGFPDCFLSTTPKWNKDLPQNWNWDDHRNLLPKLKQNDSEDKGNGLLQYGASSYLQSIGVFTNAKEVWEKQDAVNLKY